MNHKRALSAFGLLTALLVAACVSAQGKPKAISTQLVIESRGTISIDLYPQSAPKTVAHMVDLLKKKFYDGILVHRVVPGFVVQAGDPGTKKGGINAPGIGSGGSGQNVPFESNSLTNDPGTMAMALSAPRSATGDSQWFINLEPNHQLDGDYCVFGKVTKGMDVVRRVKAGDKITSFKVVP